MRRRTISPRVLFQRCQRLPYKKSIRSSLSTDAQIADLESANDAKQRRIDVRVALHVSSRRANRPQDDAASPSTIRVSKILTCPTGRHSYRHVARLLTP